MTADRPGTGRSWRAASLWPDAPGKRGGRPVVALLTPTWESSSEEGWITRQVAGALAVGADVHVITPDGAAPDDRIDSVFALHQLGTPIARTAELHRDLLIEAVTATSRRGELDRRVPPSIAPLLDRGVVDPWHGATPLLEKLRPDRVVVAGHQHVGAVDAVDRAVPDVPLALLALGTDLDDLSFPHFDRVVARAGAILAVTETERRAIVDTHGRPHDVHRIGAPLSANPSALGEPNPWVGDTGYVLVLTDADSGGDDEVVELARLIRYSFPDRPVGISSTDQFAAWHQGRRSAGWPVERSSDLARLLAWARVTVDLRPGPLFARRSVESLLFGTPVVVPAGSRAQEHAQRGRGGLWFSTPAELTWCIEALLEPELRDPLGAQGRAYAEDEYGSTGRFVDRVSAAVGIGDMAVGTRSRR